MRLWRGITGQSGSTTQGTEKSTTGSQAGAAAAAAGAGGGGGGGGRADGTGITVGTIPDLRTYILNFADSMGVDIGTAIRTCVTQLEAKTSSNPTFWERGYLTMLGSLLVGFQTLMRQESEGYRGLLPALAPYFPLVLRESYSRSVFLATLEVVKVSI